MSNLIRGSRGSQISAVNKRVEITGKVAFADKILPDGSKIYKREHGISGEVQNTVVNLTFVVPYDLCKITAIEFIGAKLGDTANFKVLDTSLGAISGTPNALLNQFGFDVNIAANYHLKDSEYDADLIKDMTLLIEYDAMDELIPREIYINFILHEVKN